MGIYGVSNGCGNVVTSTVELKTPQAGVTRTEQIKTGYSKVNDYSKYLQGKYGYMNTGLTSMEGVPTTVTVSPEFLKKCMNDLEKAKYLEENLAAIPDCAKKAVSGCLGTLTNLSYSFDENGNITITGSGSSDPDGKIARENAQRKARENKEKERKIKERRAARKAEEEKMAAKRAEKKAAEKAEEDKRDKAAQSAREIQSDRENAASEGSGEYTLNITGRDIKAVTQEIAAASKGVYVNTSTFDVMG